MPISNKNKDFKLQKALRELQFPSAFLLGKKRALRTFIQRACLI
ncbi:hypothetical protein HMPREF9439_01942 [Parasutterella excrementihominis YIT 11859]|uniref:Uncharacterized protein n=1 Tax=Parasutterella excrementihominis YIT 11859 TaxID=762966 RepID=F3QLW9_9BURK|nr:hypothetical protein HMPREF9439_01942 [Parasutterella excrementihominis YIT 11859]